MSLGGSAGNCIMAVLVELISSMLGSVVLLDGEPLTSK